MWWSNYIFIMLKRRLLFLLIAAAAVNGQEVMDCEDQFRNTARSLPCLCQEDPTYNGTKVNCDRIAFFGDFPLLPFRQPIVVFSQRFSGVQNLEAQLFTASNIPLKKVDFSHNLLRRLMERTFDGVENTLEELILSHNLLGDQLNPIFSTNEFLQLNVLRHLDLSYNQLRALDSNVFRGLKNLNMLNLAGNELIEVPTVSLHGLSVLRILQLENNLISSLNPAVFPNSLASLTNLDLSANSLSSIQNGAFSGLQQLEVLQLSKNKLKTVNSQVFSVLSNLQHLDLSNNFLDYFPTEAIIGLRRLKKLNLSSNNIQTIEDNAFGELQMLEYLDLSRNSLSILTPSFFNGLSQLKELNLAYNTFRKLEEADESMFQRMTSLKVLDLSDCQIWQFPSTSLQGLSHLQKLVLDYNNIVIVSDQVMSASSHVDELSLSHNLIQELPDGLFRNFRNLKLLNLYANKIDFVSQEIFETVADNLIGIDIGFNDIKDWPKLIMPKLYILSITMNQISKVEGDSFNEMPLLVHLNMSFNQITQLPKELFRQNKFLEHLDLQGNAIEQIGEGIFNNGSFIKINLKSNRIRELPENTFQDLWKLQHLDLSNNEIVSVKNGAFDELPSLKSLDLSNNHLTSLKGDFFVSRTQIEVLDLNRNQISYLYPNSFVIHRKLREVNLSDNKLTFFPIEIINSIKSLEHINLANNRIQFVNSADFANMPSLKILQLQGNEIREIESKAFANSTQLQWIYLQNNQISHLDENTFKRIARLNLDLSYNNLTSLPSDLFVRHSNVFQLESINLAGNNLNYLPVSALKKQYSVLEEANLSRNRIQHLPSNSDVLVNVKQLDLSGNPLTVEAHSVLFGEPKSVRKLSVAGTNIETLPSVIESPFLKELNLSNNSLTKIKSTTFERTSLLMSLDLSSNRITNLNSNMEGVWNFVPQLRRLNLSSNPIQYIVKGDFDQLINVELLDLSNLSSLIHLDCEALSQLHQLKQLHLFGYPALNFLEVQECLANINVKLEKLFVEIKEPSLQSHLQRSFSPRINELSITGDRLTSLSPSCLTGIKSPSLTLNVQRTSLNNLPPTLFASLPVSIQLDVGLGNNEITSLNSQLINSLENKQMHVRLKGLDKNPLHCDCNLHPIWKLLHEKLKLNSNAKYYNAIDLIWNLSCSSPSHLRGRRIAEINYDDLACGDVVVKASTPAPYSSTYRHHTTPFRRTPDIIFEVPSSKRPYPGFRGVLGGRTTDRRQNLTKFDTVVIGIVAGVCAFVIILILIVCIVRLRSSSPVYPPASSTLGCSINVRPTPGHHCTCLKTTQNNASCYPASFYTGTLHHPQPIKMMAIPAPMGTMGRIQSKAPYYITYPESEHENR